MKWHEGWIGGVHNDKEIKGFFDDYRWLSNFHEAEVHYDGLVYKSSEAAYQAAKTLDLVDRERFTTMNAGIAKKEGKKLELREGWEAVKLTVMNDILVDKFTRHADLRQKLLDTGGKFLEETNWWGDQYWGVCRDVGQNHLGKILMLIRTEIIMGLT